MIRYLFGLAIAVLLFQGAVQAQDQLPESLGAFYTYGDVYFLETITLPGNQPEKGRAVVLFRFSHDLLTFTKTEKLYAGDDEYIATPTFFVEAIRSDGVISDRAYWNDTVRVRTYAATNAKDVYLAGALELHLRPGLYVLKYTLSDGTPGGGFTQQTTPFKMDDFSSPSPAIGQPLFLRNVGRDTVEAAMLDGNAIFGEPIQAYVPLASPESAKSLRYELLRTPSTPSGTPETIRTGLSTVSDSITLGSPIPSGNGLRFPIEHRNDTAARSRHGTILSIQADDLDRGDYLLLLTYEAGQNSVTDSVRFNLTWENMPLSLTRVEYAIDALYPIADDATISELRSGGPEERKRKFERFWKEKDPTPETAFNEKMAAYYGRVDYAFFNFKTIDNPDGAHTDRGKIYILFGPPTEVRREMSPEQEPRVVWLYRNAVGRRFVFIDRSESGTYRLVEYNDL